MKRIISVFLTVAMLASMLAMAVSAYDQDVYESITNENVMSFKITNAATGEETTTFAPGDEIHIIGHMDSIWGDPTIEDDIVGYEGNVLPGAYGMQAFASCLVFPLENFTPKAGNDLQSLDTTINNAGIDPTTEEEFPVVVTKTSLSDAKAGGYYTFITEAATFNGDEDQYAMFTGSGDLCRWKLTVNEAATPGTYLLPVGAYCITDLETGASQGLHPKYEFFGQWYADIGHSDSQLQDRPVNFTSPTGQHVNDDPTNGAYLAITIEGNVTEEDTAAAAAVDALIEQIGTVYNAGTVTKIDGINYDNLYTYTADTDAYAASQNFSIKFKMMPIGYGDGFGFFGGWTDWNGGADVIFWNAAQQKFMIGTANGPVNATEVTSVKAESEALDLPINRWTNVEFVYAGAYMAVKVDGVTVCETSNASTGYSFYIFYPSDVQLYVDDMIVTDGTTSYDYDAFLNGYNANAYGTVELDSGAAIQAAQDAYDALTAVQQTLVTKKDVLDAAIAEYAAIDEYHNAAAANIVIAMIDDIGDVLYHPFDATLDSGAKIAAAEKAYSELTDAQKELVENYETLTAARAEYDAQIVAYDKACASDVDTLIAAIGDVTFESRADIEAAEKAYNALTDTQKGYVTLYDTLVAARAAYDTYAPIMNVEILVDAIGDKFFQGFYTFQNFTSTNGYADVKMDPNGDNTTGDFELTFDFVYTAANTTSDDDSGIALFRNGGSYVGYNFKLGAFVIGNNGGFINGNKGPTEITASADYDLVAGKSYTMTIKFVGAVATIYLDGVEMVSASVIDPNYAYVIMYPQNCDVFFDNDTLTVNGATVNGGIRWAGAMQSAGIDVLAPISIEDKIEAAEAAMVLLTDDQLALLDDSYKTALIDARAEFDALLAAIQANADAVSAQIAAMATEDDAIAARSAYFALTPGAKTLVTNYDVLNVALAGYTMDKIDAIGDVIPDSEAAIFAAESAYGALIPAERELVTNYDVLTAARAEINAQYAAIANAEAAIAMLQAGGSAIVNVADGGTAGSYSQFEDNDLALNGSNAVEEYAFSFDVYVDSISDATNSYIGGSSANSVFVGYDLVRKTVFVANAGPWGYSSSIDAASIVAEADFDLQLQTWYDFKFVMGNNTAEIYVDGELILETAITEPNGWFIYYPKNNVAYYDNVEFWYAGEKQTSMSTFTTVGAGNWRALSPVGNPGYHLTDAAPVGPIDITDPDLITAARDAYDAVPAKAQYAVSNYDVLEAAETPVVPPVVNPDAQAAAEIDALIAAIGEVTLDSEAAIVAARAAVDAADEAVLAYVTGIPTLEAAEATLAQLKADAEADAAAQAAAAEIDALIAAIGEVTLDSEAAIVAARAAVDAADEAVLAYVTGIPTLEAAEAALEDLKNDAAVIAQSLIDALDVPAATYINYADVLAQKDAIVTAKVAYDALSDEQKAEVDATALTAALEAYNRALNYNCALNNTGIAPNIDVVGGVEEITVYIDPVDNAVKYWIYVDGEIVATTTETSITVPASAGDCLVKVAVAINEVPELGSYATYVSATTDEVAVTVEAAAPVTLTAEATATENSITATWNAIDGCAAYYVTFTVGKTEIVVKTTNTSYTLAKYVTADTAYTVAVKAIAIDDNAVYTTIESNVVEGVTPIANFRITDAILDTEAQTLTATWNKYEGATTYYVIATNLDSGVTTTVKLGDVDTATITAKGTSYDIVVKAVAAGKIIATETFSI